MSVPLIDILISYPCLKFILLYSLSSFLASAKLCRELKGFVAELSLPTPPWTSHWI